ncbi:MAG TPA: ATP-binding cassette domain-containing protein [Candidatus Eisenbacteria bacterium]
MIRVEGASRSVAAVDGAAGAAAGPKATTAAGGGPRRALLHPVHLTIEPGSAHLILGANGSGKTTLIRILAGIVPPTEGRVLLDGEVVAAPGLRERDQRPLWPRVAALFEEPDPQFLSDTVEGEIAFGLESLGMSGDEIRARAREAIEAYGLGALAAREPRTLSAGEKARTLLAAAMAARPATLLLDQTLAHLDPGSRRALEARLAAETRAGSLSLLRTHQDADAPYPGERLHVLAGGSLRAADDLSADDVLEGRAVPFPLALRVSAALAARGAWEGPLVQDAASLVARLEGAAVAGAEAPRVAVRGGSAGPPVITLAGVGVTPRGKDGGRPVLEGFDLALGAGEVVALIGASGSGKTTALHVAAGLREPTRGRAWRAAPARDGAPAAALALEYPERQLFGRTVLEDVAAALWIAGVAPLERARRGGAALREIGLDPEAFGGRIPATLSEGEKRRAALASFLIEPPQALLLDEPTAGLDPEGRRSLRSAIAALRAAGRAVLFASHDLDFVSSVADRVLVLGRAGAGAGRVLGQGAPEAVWRDAALLTRAGLPAPDHVAIAAALRRRGLLGGHEGTGGDSIVALLDGSSAPLTGAAPNR